MDVPFGFGLQDKTAIVVGAGAKDTDIGNGRAAALLLAKAGANVVCVDRNEPAAEMTASMIIGDGGSAFHVSGDVCNSSDCQKIVAATLEKFGRIDILDNNVGIGSRGDVTQQSYSGWQKVMQTNVDSMFLMSKAAIPAIAETSDGGSIINISSISALRPRGLTAYSTSKGAVIALTKAMAVDHAASGIRVNCICPGPVYTPMVYGEGMSDQAREARRDSTLLGVEGTGWDVGQSVLFLASSMSRFITGQVFVVDGGVTLKSPPRGH